MTDIEPTWLTQRDAARYLSISVRTLYTWTKRGDVQVHVFPGGMQRYRIDELDAIAKRREPTGCGA